MAIRSEPVAAVATIPAAGAPDPLVRVFSLLAAVRRRWRLWAATAVIGLFLSSVFFLARPPTWTGTTTLLLRRSAATTADPARQMETDSRLAQSLAVLTRAADRLPRGSLSGYTVAVQSNDVLQFITKGRTESAAVQNANALASAFLAFRNQQMAEDAQALSTVLKQESDPLAAQVADLNNKINAAAQQTTTNGTQSGLGGLLTNRDQLQAQLTSIEQRSADAGIAASVAAITSRVLDPGYAFRASRVRLLALDLAAGLVGGAAAGAGWVLFGAAIGDRVRRREDVMVALKAPVAVSVESVVDRHRFRGRPVRVPIRRLRRRQRKPGRDVTTMVRHLRRALAASHTAKPALLVVSVDSDWSAAPVLARVADELRREGNDVLMADFSKEGALSSLLRAREQVSVVHSGPPVSKLWKGSGRRHSPPAPDSTGTIDEWLRLNDLADEAGIILVLATLDPAVGASHLVGLAANAVVVVTAGRSTPTALRSTARIIRSVGVQLHSAILVGADRDDETSGLVPPPAATVAEPLIHQPRR